MSAAQAARGFDPTVAGRRAECDGGALVVGVDGTGWPARMTFVGTLTGDYVDHGDPPWRWYLLDALVERPDSWPAPAVWCESESLFLVAEDRR